MSVFAALERQRPQIGPRSPVLQRKCACGTRTSAGDSCQACHNQSQRSEIREAPPIVHEVLKSSGMPLPQSARAFFEPRVGHDLSSVRVHTDERAARSAREVGANAYTVGANVIFAAGQWSGAAENGLLAHELVHVRQQAGAVGVAGPLRISNDGDSMEREADAGARKLMSGGAFQPRGHSAEIVSRQAAGLPSAEKSLAPADKTFVQLPAFDLSSISLRSPMPRCGPDATDWFVSTVNGAMAAPRVLLAKMLMNSAADSAKTLGLTTDQLGEAGATILVQHQHRKLGAEAPALNDDIKEQLSTGSQSLLAVLHAVPKGMSKEGQSPAAKALASLGAALFIWKSLVDHGAVYDFKRHVLNNPKSKSCPDQNCNPGEVGTLTLCPSPHRGSCYEADVPGNFFYAVIGKFIGLSKTTLQLGSQYAELTDAPRPGRPKVEWDTPNDTAAIALAHDWPLPLTRTTLCGAVPRHRSLLALRPDCQACPEIFS